MILETVAVLPPAPPTQPETLELLQDREWIAAEFAAIMTASGFGDRVVVGTLREPPPDQARLSCEPDLRRSLSRRFVRAVPRVRSPPARR